MLQLDWYLKYCQLLIRISGAALWGSFDHLRSSYAIGLHSAVFHVDRSDDQGGSHNLILFRAIIHKLYNLFIPVKNENIDAGPQPPNLLDVQISLVSGVVFDKAPVGKNFGDVLVQPYPYVVINETVYATFVSYATWDYDGGECCMWMEFWYFHHQVSGHPRNNLMAEKTFMNVEQQTGNTWKVIRTDANWDTLYDNLTILKLILQIMLILNWSGILLHADSLGKGLAGVRVKCILAGLFRHPLPTEFTGWIILDFIKTLTVPQWNTVEPPNRSQYDFLFTSKFLA